MPAPKVFSEDGLFAFVQPTEAEEAAINAALPAPTHLMHYVRVNTALVTSKASPFWRRSGEGRVVLPLSNHDALEVVIDESEMLGADRFTSTGHVAGWPQSRAVFAFNAGFLHATIDDGERGTYVLRVATEGLSQFYQVDPALVAPCGGERKPVVDAAAIAAAAERHARAGDVAAGPGADPVPAADNALGVEVHVMMAVTQDVLPTLAGAARVAALTSAFDAALARVNGNFAASLITARVRLVKVAETTYDETRSAGNKVQDEALTALQSATDGKMDELHALRDQCGADLVCLVLARRDFASSGLAFVIDTPGDTTNALFSFSVVQYDSVAGTSVVAHEFGHSFGCAHDRENAFSPGAYSYSYGYRFFGADGQRYRDIMAYPPGIELGYFSNPTVVAPAPVSVPLGIPAGRPGESDTARTIEQAAFEVAGYRLQTQTAAAAGTLVNVATRATADAADRPVIAGFTVAGPQPKPTPPAELPATPVDDVTAAQETQTDKHHG
ncbi:MAG: M12 family metallo-peptidase [Verrucomicrobia bacterium]|nr:M12 family metallo-peptidase [Verrucomicrobiota bacterium]